VDRFGSEQRTDSRCEAIQPRSLTGARWIDDRRGQNLRYTYANGWCCLVSFLTRVLVRPILAASRIVSRKVIRPQFDERKTAAAASILLNEAGGEITYFRLIKLLYIAERDAWRELGHAISGDDYVAMKHGPVLSRTYDLLKDGERLAASTHFSRLIEKVDSYNVRLKGTPDDGPLSDNEVEILRRVHRENQHMDQWNLRELTHQFPEWSDPGDTSVAIDAEEVLRNLPLPEPEIERIREEVEQDAFFAQLFRTA
jgi:uncharacterized phage-associated protein